MTARYFHDTVRRVKETEMNELPWYGVFVERAIVYCICVDIYYFLTIIMLLFKFKDINVNEVQ